MLRKHKQGVLAFAFEPGIPLTSNQAERDLRPAKVKPKVSGCFRTQADARVYVRLQAAISTFRKQNINVFNERISSPEQYAMYPNINMRVAFSPKVYAYEGEGVNIFDKFQWGSEGSLRLLASYIRLSRTILTDIRLDPEQRAFVRGQLASSRRSFAASIVHLAWRRKRVDWARVRATFREDPATAALFVPNVLLRILRKESHS